MSVILGPVLGGLFVTEVVISCLYDNSLHFKRNGGSI